MKAAKNVSAHALQRFKEIHKSKGTKHQMISYCNNGIEIDPQMAATLSGAEVGSKRAMSNDIFSLKKDHSGIFVVDRILEQSLHFFVLEIFKRTFALNFMVNPNHRVAHL